MALIYTSGTTGYPKPAIYTHGANLWAGGLGIMMKWGPEDTLFTGCPLFHTLGLLKKLLEPKMSSLIVYGYSE